MIAHTIQLALAPVFMLVAIGNIMNILSTRLGRIVDRARQLETRHGGTTGDEHDLLVGEIRAIDRRIHLITRAILVLVISGISVGMTVLALFVGELARVPLEPVVAGFFLLAVALLMWGLTLFLRETRIAAGLLRIPAALLELDRQI